MDSLRIFKLWAAAAWADGTLHPAEAAALRRLLDASDDLGETERAEAMSLLQSPPPASVIAEVKALKPFAREGVYRAALGIVRLDSKVTPDEQSWVTRLRDMLDLDPATIARIDAENDPAR